MLAAIAIVLVQLRVPAAVQWGGAVLAVLSALLAAATAVRVSVRVDGTDLVYRSSTKEKRCPLAGGISCKQTSASWAFSNATGKRLFLLNGWMFRDADVAAFCAQAGIAYTGPSPQELDRLRVTVARLKRNRVIFVLAAAFFIVFTGLSASSQESARSDLARYQAASDCESASPAISNCKLQAHATVTSSEGHKAYTTLHLTLIAAGGDYQTRTRFSPPKAGEVVPVEVWSSRITMIDERPTLDDPSNDPNLNIDLVITGFGLAGLLSLGLALAGQYLLVASQARLRAAKAGSVNSS